MFAWKDILERALWTAVQAALGALPPNFTLAAALGEWRLIAMTGITAGLAFLISIVKNMAKQRLEIAQLGEPVAAIAAAEVAVIVADK